MNLAKALTSELRLEKAAREEMEKEELSLFPLNSLRSFIGNRKEKGRLTFSLWTHFQTASSPATLEAA